MNTTYRPQDILKIYYGYDQFRPKQEAIINSILAGHDTLAIMPTGGGKSICYQIPALLMPGITLVISPLIALMKDQVDALLDLELPVTFLNSSLDFDEYIYRLRDIKKGKYKIIYLAPESLSSSSLEELAVSVPISHIAVDEAHCISAWGHDFRLSYGEISNFIERIPKRPVISAFTATATPKVKADIMESLNLQAPNSFETGYERDNLYLNVVKDSNKLNFILKYLAQHRQQSGIIYCATRKETEEVFEALRKKNIAAGYYHAGLCPEERKQIQEQFLYDDIQVMIATNAFGMGIDKSNVRYVIHYNMPETLEAYYQEAGRAGRDGARAECYLLYSPRDLQIRRYLIEKAAENGEISQELLHHRYLKLQQMNAYCHTGRCLSAYILEYFGDDNGNDCNRCHNCLKEYVEKDITVDAMKAISCVMRMKQSYGLQLTAAVLKGSNSKKVLLGGFQHLSTYGLMSAMGLDEIRNFLLLLVAEGYLYQTTEAYPILMVTSLGKDVLLGKESVYQKVPLVHQSADETHVFEALRTLRHQIAKTSHLPPYMIFSDKSLLEMARKMPASEEEMLEISGVGPLKYKKYGDAFLRVLREMK
ncbi:DNA helicase RecQ [Clostridiales bacterium COT073_COT-073]|nr:DNA helicase RecQ [Clostridiales bacterium COT073_COT-073]